MKDIEFLCGYRDELEKKRLNIPLGSLDTGAPADSDAISHVLVGALQIAG